MKDVTHSVSKEGKTSHRGRIGLYGLAAIIWALYYYVVLPPIHYASMAFWGFIVLIVGTIFAIQALTSVHVEEKYDIHEGKTVKALRFDMKSRLLKWLAWAAVVLGGVAILSYGIFSPLFFASGYSQMIQPQAAEFQSDFPETDVTQIPLIDRDTASRLGNRRIGALTDLVSQFEAAEDYTQINIQNHPYRVSPLTYAGFWKWISNQNEGIPNYLQVDMVTGDVDIKTPSQPIRYSEGEYFNRNIHRHLRFRHPFTLFGSPSFEVDDEGNPYYIASTYKRNFFLREPEVDGLIVVNAMTGESQHYALDEIPTWVDRVYSAELILHQLEMNGLYKNGFWNTIFAKKGVTKPTEGYNYLPMKDDIYLYTGITSVASDNSNIGFVLVNTRTKETKMYTISAAEEYSAMSSAEGSVQETGYKATFPLLINLDGRPMYILSLKDESGLIKKYALIDVENYQNVFVDNTVDRLIQKYQQATPDNPGNDLSNVTTTTVTGTIQDIKPVVVNGNTIYYMLINGNVYRAPAVVHERLPFIGANTTVEMEVTSSGEVQKLTISSTPS